MTRKKSALPKLRTDEEIAQFWARHDLTDYMDEFTEVDELPEPEKNTNLISIRVPSSVMKTLKVLARKKGVGYSPYARMLILDGIRREAKGH